MSEAQLAWDIDLEEDPEGRWGAEIQGLPGVTVHGETRDAALAKAVALAMVVLPDVDHEEDGIDFWQEAGGFWSGAEERWFARVTTLRCYVVSGATKDQARAQARRLVDGELRVGAAEADFFQDALEAAQKASPDDPEGAVKAARKAVREHFQWFGENSLQQDIK